VTQNTHPLPGLGTVKTNYRDPRLPTRKQEFGSLSLQSCPRCQTHAFLPTGISQFCSGQ
jgi:hypothetical protein